MRKKFPTADRVPDTNSPASVDKEPFEVTYQRVSSPRERENKIIYKHADMLPTGKKWDQTTNAVGVYGSSARTTFRSFDADDSDEEKYDKMWRYQMGRGQTYESSRNKNAVRDEATWKLCDAVLQNCEVPDRERHMALQNVLRQNIMGFNGHYNGADGACVGFALLELCDCPEEAEDCWIADRAEEVLEFDEQRVADLISYTFREHGENN